MIIITTINNLVFISLLYVWFISCGPRSLDSNGESLNIVWLVAEDLGPFIPAFGDSSIETPNLDRLSKEGVRYTNVYSVSGVCSPSRAALATGMYPTSIGAHNMRTLFQQPAAKQKGIINYEVVPPPEVKMVSQIMRENDYYCTNNRKEDYQFFKSVLAWDESSIFAHWRNRPKNSKFFSVFNFGVTHESNIWNPWFRQFDLDPFPPHRSLKGGWWKQFDGLKKPLYVDQGINIKIPPYLPETNIVLEDMKRMYSNIIEMDDKVGLIISQLEEDGLLEKTIIVWYTDHGGPLPRQKRLLYDSGINVPLIIRYPDKDRAGEIDQRMISFVDFAPTLLSMAKIKPSPNYQGHAFEGEHKASHSRKYIHAAADRFDEHYDMIRAVRDKRFKYLRNFNTEKPYYLPLEYRERMGSMKELLRLRDSGQLDEIQMQWFRSSKPNEELFDVSNDPHELRNIADNPVYKDKLIELRNECSRWMEEIKDMGFIKEEKIIQTFWPDKKQPKTSLPVVEVIDGYINIKTETPGASIGYKYGWDEDPGDGWRPYSELNKPLKGERIKCIAHRIGFSPSDTIYFPDN